MNQDVPIKLVEAENGFTRFVYVGEGVPPEDNYQAPTSSMTIERQEVTHIDETVLTGTAALDKDEASLASGPDIMDPASKQMVDDLVESETTDDPNNKTPRFGNFADGPSLASTVALANETSYNLIGSSTLKDYLENLDNQPPASPHPLLPSIYNSPFAPQPGEGATPASRPGTAKRITPSHSQQGSQTKCKSPFQHQSNCSQQNSQTVSPQFQKNSNGFHITDSTMSTMSDPTDPNPHGNGSGSYGGQPLVNGVPPFVGGYTTGRQALRHYSSHSMAVPNASPFRSSEVFDEGSQWPGSRTGINIQTPPNGQGSGG